MRESGILLHVTSLPEKGGIGTLGETAYSFVDFLSGCGIYIWQVLPVGPTGFGESPYQSASVCAGNPMMIDLKTLVKEDMLDEDDFVQLPDSDWVDFDAVHVSKDNALRAAYRKSGFSGEQKETFIKEQPWVSEYALFMAIKHSQNNASWQYWPEPLRMHDDRALQEIRELMAEEINYHIFVQYLFFRQWRALKEYANQHGVRLFGDMPIYAAEDSVEVWSKPSDFQMDETRHPTRVAGVPPDYFSEDGQLWGNPLYNWDAMEKDGFSWWISRLRAAGQLYDMVRVDHFIGFANYYAIPSDSKTAKNGTWILAPGKKLFDTIKKELPDLHIIAEDLGEINDRVKSLLAYCGYPGMKVLGFAFDGGMDNPHRPELYTRNTVAYTGTHDNNTTLGIIEEADEKKLENIYEVLCAGPEDDLTGLAIEAVWSSAADTAVVPMQDFFRLGSNARMNVPGTIGHNWGWRMTRMPDETTVQEIKTLNKRYHR